MEQKRTGTAFATLAVAALALCLFAAAASASRGEASAALLARRSAMLELLHHQAEIALVTAAQDRSFEAYFHATSDTERAELKERLDRLADNIRTTFLVDGVCLVALSGEEIASTSDEDSEDAGGETEADFFSEAFRHPARHVYISPIFVSEATHRWVVSYATPIVVDGTTRAILHYEHAIADYQKALVGDLEGVAGYLVLVDAQGWVIADSRRPIDTTERGGSADPKDYFDKFEWQGMSLEDLEVHLGRDGGVMESLLPGPDGDYRIAYREIRGWTLLLFEKA